MLWEHLNFYAGPILRLEWIGKRLALKHFKGILCITKKDQGQYLAYKTKHGGSSEVYQIYNLTQYKESQKAYNVDSKKIISCGYMGPLKGYDYLVAIADIVIKKNEDWKWDIYGDGTERANIEKWITERGLEGKLNIKGFNPNVNELYSDYGLFVLTSRAEGMGMVLIEAQLSHLPIVSFDCPCGPSDVIEDKGNGRLIEPFDTIKMAEAINDLIEDKNKRIQYSIHTLDKHKELSKEVIMSKWDKLIREASGD